MIQLTQNGLARHLEVEVKYMAILTEYDGSVDDTNNLGIDYIVAQGFKIPSGATITGFSIRGSKGNTNPCSSFTVKIYEGGANPTAGTEKKSESFSSTSLGDYTGSPTFHDFEFTTSTGALTGGSTQYYMTLHPDDGSTSDAIRWSIDTTSSSYSDGSRWSSPYSSISWTEVSNHDLNFKIYGT